MPRPPGDRSPGGRGSNPPSRSARPPADRSPHTRAALAAQHDLTQGLLNTMRLVPPFRLGVDVGGTFTDLVLMDEASGAFVVAKTDSRPEAPRRGILDGLTALLQRERVEPEALSALVHGTTLGLNTLLQRSGALTGLLV